MVLKKRRIKYKICDQTIAKSLFTSERNKAKPRNIGFTDIDKHQYILKIEKVIGSLNKMDEYVFYEKYAKKIYKDGFNNNLQVPIEYKVCDKKTIDSKKTKKEIFYLFNILDGDINRKILHKLTKKDNINMFQQYLLSIYYLNHIIGIYHNDFFTNYRFIHNLSIYNINNLMYVKNDIKGKKENTIKVDDMEVVAGKYRGVVIDFGLSSKKYNYKLKLFYGSLTPLLFFGFKYMSEVFMVFIFLLHMLKGNFNILKIKEFYKYFESVMEGEGRREFDKAVCKNFMRFV